MKPSKVRLSLIVACAKGGVIGRENQLPWRLPEDLKYFKQVTMGKPILMGRKTYESIGRPLPGRLNIVISRQASWLAPEGVSKAESVTAALQLSQRKSDSAEVIVIGGEQIYRACLPLADRVYRTDIDLEVEGDAFFPELPMAEWRESNSVMGDSGACLAHEFKVFDRLTE